jgi:hypothetical protein
LQRIETENFTNEEETQKPEDSLDHLNFDESYFLDNNTDSKDQESDQRILELNL